jgi:hypothetical protein
MRKLGVIVLVASLAPLALSLSLSAVLPASAATDAPVPVIATGTVTNASGGAASGAVVQLYAWPSDQVLQHLRKGQVVPRTLLATTKANSAGTYSFRVSPAALRAVAVTGGYANLEAEWEYQVNKSWGVVGQAYVWPKATGVSVTFTYSRGQDTTLGVGLSPTGKKGSFSASGSETQTKTGTEGMPGFKLGNELWETHWRMAKYKVLCGRGGKALHLSGRWHCYDGICTSWQARSDGWAAGAKVLHPRTAPHTPSFDCTQVTGGPNSYFSTSSEKAVTWSGGLSVSELGFSAEAQTGYDSSAQLTFYFAKTRQLCGTDANPPNAKQLVAERR